MSRERCSERLDSRLSFFYFSQSVVYLDGLDWIGLDWIGLDWERETWRERERVGERDWESGSQVGLNCVRIECLPLRLIVDPCD